MYAICWIHVLYYFLLYRYFRIISKQFVIYLISILDNSDFVENESYRIANLKLNEFINKAKQKNWSFAYTQFSPNQYRYAYDKYEKFF